MVRDRIGVVDDGQGRCLLTAQNHAADRVAEGQVHRLVPLDQRIGQDRYGKHFVGFARAENNRTRLRHIIRARRRRIYAAVARGIIYRYRAVRAPGPAHRDAGVAGVFIHALICARELDCASLIGEQPREIIHPCTVELGKTAADQDFAVGLNCQAAHAGVRVPSARRTRGGEHRHAARRRGSSRERTAGMVRR